MTDTDNDTQPISIDGIDVRTDQGGLMSPRIVTIITTFKVPRGNNIADLVSDACTTVNYIVESKNTGNEEAPQGGMFTVGDAIVHCPEDCTCRNTEDTHDIEIKKEAKGFWPSDGFDGPGWDVPEDAPVLEPKVLETFEDYQNALLDTVVRKPPRDEHVAVEKHRSNCWGDSDGNEYTDLDMAGIPREVLWEPAEAKPND